MTRINITLSDEMRFKGSLLVSQGHFSTFSELVRVGLRLVYQNFDQVEDLKKQIKDWRRIARQQHFQDLYEKN
jgi:Arc/MetJ-type ribon-helix-helix transcriptional regulator